MPVQNVGPAGPTVVTPASPVIYARIIKLDTSAGDLTGFLACKLPKGAFLAGAYVISSGANATQSINVGTTLGGTDIINAYLPTAAGYYNVAGAGGTLLGTQLTGDIPVYAKVGTAALSFACYVKLEYYMPQQGNTW